MKKLKFKNYGKLVDIIDKTLFILRVRISIQKFEI